jgi:histidinol-phosphate aminotransferase
VELIHLDSNENPFGPSPRAVAAMQRVLSAGNRYPGNDSDDLRDKLAAVHRLSPDQIIISNGLTDLLSVIARTCLSPVQNAITSKRSFVAYPTAAASARAELIQVPTRENGYDLQAIAKAVNRDTRVIFLANPNNPTGALVTADEVDWLLNHITESVLLVIDEAYYEFAQEFASKKKIPYSRSLELVREGRNVIVLRTFSKVHGLAGIRVGYGCCSPELVSRLYVQRSIYSVSRVAQAAAIASIEDEEHIRRTIANNTAEAPRLEATLSAAGYEIVSTWANFVFCDLGKAARPIREKLKAEQIRVRALDSWGIPTALRFSIGTSEQNARMLDALLGAART